MNKKITKPTWMIHGVCGGGNTVYHTHGLNEYGSLELELNLSLEKNQACQFINLIGLEIANGKKFKDGDFDDTIFNCKIAFKEVEGIYEENQKCLRVIFPDTNYKFPWEDGCEEPYKWQISENPSEGIVH